MEHSNRYDGIHPRVVQFVRYHARKLARRRAMPGMELEDYEQDLITDLIARERRFDPARAAYPTFADRVIRHRVSTLIYLGLPRRRIDDQGPRATAGGPGLETEAEAADGTFWTEDWCSLSLDLERFPRTSAGTAPPLLRMAAGRQPAVGRCGIGAAPLLSV
jgi:hypothetical protein